MLNVLRRKSPKRIAFSNFDHLVFAALYRRAPRVLKALAIVEPDTVIGWHRAGVSAHPAPTVRPLPDTALFWRWKSRCRGGRPKVALEIRQLIRDMSLANPLWGERRLDAKG
jgi:hypothetical protein